MGRHYVMGAQKAGYCEPDIVLSFARSVGRHLSFDDSGLSAAREAYSSAGAPVAVTVATSATNWQVNVTARWNEYGKTGFTKYVVVHWKEMGQEAERRVVVGHWSHFLGKPWT